MLDDGGPVKDVWRPPETTVELLDDLTPPQPEGFLRLRRRRLRNRYADGELSAPYIYDSVERRALDAVVLVLHTADDRVCLRSSLRPPLAFRQTLVVPRDSNPSCVLWELPAGLVEPDEKGDDGIRACAVREALEETGLRIAPGAFRELGPAIFLSPGVLAERLYFLTAEVQAEQRGVPTEDGSPVEARGEVRFVTVGAALRACDEGHIGDAKSELGIRRLAARRRFEQLSKTSSSATQHSTGHHALTIGKATRINEAEC